MLSGDEAVSAASAFLEQAAGWDPGTMRIDWEHIRLEDERVLVPYNSRALLDEGRRGTCLLGNLPILVDLATGACRFMTLEELMTEPNF